LREVSGTKKKICLSLYPTISLVVVVFGFLYLNDFVDQSVSSIHPLSPVFTNAGACTQSCAQTNKHTHTHKMHTNTHKRLQTHTHTHMNAVSPSHLLLHFQTKITERPANMQEHDNSIHNDMLSEACQHFFVKICKFLLKCAIHGDGAEDEGPAAHVVQV